MKKILFLSTVLAVSAGFSGCSSDSAPAATTTAPITTSPATPLTNATLNGTWIGNCFDDGAPPWVRLSVLLDNGNATVTVTSYSDDTCTNVSMIDALITATYTLGAVVTVDGTVAGITSATQIDTIQITGVSPGQKSYDIYAIVGNKLYVGDDSPPNDGTTPATRPIKLDADVDEILTKQ